MIISTRYNQDAPNQAPRRLVASVAILRGLEGQKGPSKEMNLHLGREVR